jgi:hypothetical protein
VWGRDGGHRDVEAVGQFLDGFFSLSKEVNKAAAVGVGDGVKDAVAR